MSSAGSLAVHFRRRAAHREAFTPGSRSAFTLIELLVVIAIIAVVAAILFPVFAQVRESGRKANCLSNLKQIGIGFGMYGQDYDETLCPSMIAVFTSPVRSYNWFGGYEIGMPATNIVVRNDWGLLWQYVNSAPVRDCPSAADLPAANGATVGNGYGYNSEFLTEVVSHPGPPRATVNGGIPLHKITHPTETILLADVAIMTQVQGAPALARSTVLYPPFTKSGSGCGYSVQVNGPSAHGRHNGMAGVLWVDGHATALKPQIPPVAVSGLKTPQALAQHNLGDLLPGPRTGDPSKDCSFFLAEKQDSY